MNESAESESPQGKLGSHPHPHLPHTAFFNDKLAALCMTWLTDDVHSIRLAATENLRRLAELFGAEWAQTHALPRVTMMHSHASHLQVRSLLSNHRSSQPSNHHSDSLPFTSTPLPLPRQQRMTALYAIQVLAHALTEDQLVGEALPLALHLAKDPVANVRFTLARTLETVAPKVREGRGGEERRGEERATQPRRVSRCATRPTNRHHDLSYQSNPFNPHTRWRPRSSRRSSGPAWKSWATTRTGMCASTHHAPLSCATSWRRGIEDVWACFVSGREDCLYTPVVEGAGACTCLSLGRRSSPQRAREKGGRWSARG